MGLSLLGLTLFGGDVISSTAPLPLLVGWSVVAIFFLAVLVGALVRPGYLQVLGLLVIEGLLVVWALWLARLLA
jgi:hypothetical protein